MIREHCYEHDWKRRYYKLDSYKVFPSEFFDIMIKEFGEAYIKTILSKYAVDGQNFRVALLKHPKATHTEV